MTTTKPYAIATAAFLLSLASLSIAGSPLQVAQSSTATSPNTETRSLVEDDREFVHEAIEGNLKEVAYAKLALEKAADARVKEFAQMMVSDHSAANEKLVALANTAQVKVPESVGLKDKAKMKLLEMRSGKRFDEAYVEDMLEDHQKDVKHYRKVSTSAKDPAVKAFAAQTLPTLEKHLERIEQIAKSIRD